jgi:hypothetical protein
MSSPSSASPGYKNGQWGVDRLVMPSGKIDTRQAILKFPPAAKTVLLLVRCGGARFLMRMSKSAFDRLSYQTVILQVVVRLSRSIGTRVIDWYRGAKT